ncbi:MAG: lipoyl(octanoyl) transferase LipB [Bacteroidetes bacterium]|jgi:lipoyl(octanoyl) transferase|nr:lipoyl(octanoyl) transferase LipB [Bacteroidota bacterium]
MNQKAVFEDLGTMDYKQAWDYQEELLAAGIAHKKNGTNGENRLLFCEHPHVFTLGRSGDEKNMLITNQLLEKVQATFYKINRGGDITYHGPGQLVGYPIFDLEKLNIGVKSYIFKLEAAIINTLHAYGLNASRLDDATGVWLDVDTPKQSRKICAIGVKISKFITMHGFALNINTDLNYFSYINPCGFIDKGVTSLEKELERTIDMQEVKDKLKYAIGKEFVLEMQDS